MGHNEQMQTIMVMRLFAKFKQRIYVNFDDKMTTDLCNLICSRLHDAGFNVVGFVGDKGTSDVGMWSRSGVNYINTTINQPHTGQLIYMFSDVLMIEIVEELVYRPWLFTSWWNRVKSSENSRTFENKYRNKFHLQIKYKASRINQDRASKRKSGCWIVFTLSCSSLRRNFPNDVVVEKLAASIELVNKWFDIMNSYSLNGIGFKKPCEQLQNSLQIFQKGILMSVTSIKGLQAEMRDKFGIILYLMTHRVNQDFLDNFFSQVRGRNGPNDHPTRAYFWKI